MSYAIFSQDGNLLDSFADEFDAQVALQRMVAEEPEAESEVAIVAMDDSGMPTGDAIYPLSLDTTPVRTEPLGGTVSGSAAAATRSTAVIAIVDVDVVDCALVLGAHSYKWDSANANPQVTPC